MDIYVSCDESQEKELRAMFASEDNIITYSVELPSGNDLKKNDAFIILNKTGLVEWNTYGGKPVLINSVTETLQQLQLPLNVGRINGWNGFLQRSVWEVASRQNDVARSIFSAIGIKPVFVKDEAGLVTPRVISMIINEAYFALNEKISTKEEIDLAMKSGTNYPFGPFEWAEIIGLNEIHHLLSTLAETDKRYLPSFTVET